MICELCGEEFRCGVNEGNDICWCMDVQAVAPIPGKEDFCWCPKCLDIKIREIQDAAKD